MKKLLCLLMTAILLLSIVTVSFHAADIDRTIEGADIEVADEGAGVDVAQTGNPYPTTQNVDGDGYYEVPCTWFAWQQAYDRLGISLPGWGNAVDWWQGAINAGYSTGSTPQPESIAVWSGDYYGHVAYVTSVSGGNTFTVNEGGRTDLDHTNSHGVKYGYTLTNAVGGSRPYDTGKTLLGFIYLNNPTPQGHVMSESEAAGRTIPDGDYWICNKIASDYFLDLSGDYIVTENGTNVHMWITTNIPGKYDVFHFKYLNNGFYQITQMNSNMALDVYGGGLDRGANVNMWEASGSNAQQWSIETTEGGYKLRSRCCAYYLDVSGASYSGGTNVQVWESNNTDAQYFGLIPYAPDERPLADGIYAIGSALSNSCFLDIPGFPENYKIESNVQVWNNMDEKFLIEYAGNGYYQIEVANTDLVLDVNNDGSISYLSNCRNTQICDKNNKRNQRWKIRKNNDGTYYFISQINGYYLDIEGANSAAGTNVSVHQYNGKANQKWKPYRVLQNDMVTVNDVEITNNDTAFNPEVAVTVDNEALTANTDYTYTINTDIASGKGTVTITGKGDYCGTVTREFRISVLQILGDADGNGIVNISDATVIQRHLTNISVSYPKETLMNADVNGDGVLTIIDATLIQRYVTKINTPYPIGEPKT